MSVQSTTNWVWHETSSGWDLNIQLKNSRHVHRCNVQLLMGVWCPTIFGQPAPPLETLEEAMTYVESYLITLANIITCNINLLESLPILSKSQAHFLSDT